MYSKTIVFLLALGAFLTPRTSSAAVADLIWNDTHTSGGDVSTDPGGNLIVSGNLFGTVDFGGGPMTSLNQSIGDAFVVRLDSSGQFLWQHQFELVGGNGMSPVVSAQDDFGNAYLTFVLRGSTTIDFGAGPIPGNQGVMVSFDASGNHRWSFGIGNGKVTDIVANATDVFVVGRNDSETGGGVDVGGGLIATAGSYDGFVAKLSNLGAHAWSMSFGDSDRQTAQAVAIDASGNVVMAGGLTGSADFGGGALTGSGELYLASFTNGGAHRWSQVFTGSFLSSPTLVTALEAELATAPSGDIVLAGQFRNTVEVGGPTLTSNGMIDNFLAQYDTNGNHTWSNAYGGTTNDFIGTIDVDSVGNILFTGGLFGSASYGGPVLNPIGIFSILLALYDSNGSHLFSERYGTGTQCYGRFDSGDNIVLNGSGGTSLDFGGGPLPSHSLFLAKLEGPNGGGATDTEPIPTSQRTLRAFPNPFNPSTTIRFSLAHAEAVELEVFDIRGRRVARLLQGTYLEAGHHELEFRPEGASGVLFARLRTQTQTQTLKIEVLK